MNSSPTAIPARTILESSGVLQVREFAHERWVLHLLLIFSTQFGAAMCVVRPCVLMSMCWRSWRPSCSVATRRHACCLATMVVSGSSGVLVWEYESSYVFRWARCKLVSAGSIGRSYKEDFQHFQIFPGYMKKGLSLQISFRLLFRVPMERDTPRCVCTEC